MLFSGGQQTFAKRLRQVCPILSISSVSSKGSGLFRNKIDLVAPDTKGVAFKPPLSRCCSSQRGNGLRRGTVGKDVEDKGPEQESRDFKGKAGSETGNRKKPSGIPYKTCLQYSGP